MSTFFESILSERDYKKSEEEYMLVIDFVPEEYAWIMKGFGCLISRDDEGIQRLSDQMLEEFKKFGLDSASSELYFEKS